MDFPEDFKKMVEELSASKLKEEKERTRSEKKRLYDEKVARNRRIKRGISHAGFLFKWANKFSHSEDGRKLIDLYSKTYLHGVMFFDGKIEGKPWRGLGISSEGLWWTRTGCGASPRIVNSPKELAAEIDTEILVAACESINSGKVWDCIRDRCDFNRN